nr:hypothetical protein [Catenulispora acidiphila]
MDVRTDLVHGGRWTSLRGADREWLWQNPDAAGRSSVLPGQSFVDAGGLEECVPTVRGTPDHGDAWSRPWRSNGGTEVCQSPDFVLTRRIEADGDSLRVHYVLRAEPGYRFLWAAHALLDVSEQAVLRASDSTATRVYPDAGARYAEGLWPAPWQEVRLDRLGPDDGTALGAILTGCRGATVVDGADALSFALRADPGVPVSLALWRNLRGFPARHPYRSIGVEPMLGAVFDLAEAGPGDAAVVSESGEIRWEMAVTATRRDDTHDTHAAHDAHDAHDFD